MFNQKGAALITAVGVMLFVGLTIAAVLPLVTDAVRHARMDGDVIQADFAAAAGATRFRVAWSNRADDWRWLGQRQDVVLDDDPPGYAATCVDAGGLPLPVLGVPAPGTYTVTVTGTAHGVQRQTQFSITMP